MAINLEGIVTWLKGWFYEKSEVNTLLNGKVNEQQGQANKNVVTSSTGVITLEDKPTIPDVSGFIDTAGTGLSKSGTTLNHSNSITAQTSAVFKKIKYDAQGHITGTASVSGSDIPNHTHYITDVTDDNVYTNISSTGILNNTLYSIDTAIGNLQSIKAIEVVSDKGTASADTMNKLYIVAETVSGVQKVNVYYTKQTGSTYEWVKLDDNILDELDLSWGNITDKPSSFTPSSHTHNASDVKDANAHSNIATSVNATQQTINTAIDSSIGTLSTYLPTRAPINHSSSNTTYGLGTTSHYGHNKVIDNLTSSTLVNGESLSAHQGYVLKNLIDEKQDEITSIVLVPKSTDANGKIIFYTNDEPSP